MGNNDDVGAFHAHLHERHSEVVGHHRRLSAATELLFDADVEPPPTTASIVRLQNLELFAAMARTAFAADPSGHRLVMHLIYWFFKDNVMPPVWVREAFLSAIAIGRLG